MEFCHSNTKATKAIPHFSTPSAFTPVILTQTFLIFSLTLELVSSSLTINFPSNYTYSAQNLINCQGTQFGLYLQTIL